MEELELPKTVITKLIKAGLPDGTLIQKDAKTALSRSVLLFISFLTSTANDLTLSSKQKTIQAKHVLEALKSMGFEDFCDPLKENLEKYQSSKKAKKVAAVSVEKEPAASDE